MAVVLRNCIVCNTEFPSKNMRARFCKSACKSIHHRATKKPVTSKEETINEERGIAIMSTQAQAPMQFVFQESEYRSRCTEAKVRYENTLETPVAVAHGAIVEFTPSSVESAFEDYHNYRLAGYTPLDPASPLPSISVINSPVTGALVTMYLLKPEAAQKAELEAIYADVRVEYQAELDRDLEAHIDRHVQLLIEAEDRAKAKEEAELQEKRRQEKHAEVLAARDKLRAELIEAGKLNNDGYAA